MSSVKFLEKLLDGVAVEWKALGDIAEIYGGLTGKSKTDFENGNAKYVPYKNIFGNIEVNFNCLDSVKVADAENQNAIKYGDILFTGSSETAQEVGMSSSVTTKYEESIYLNSFSFGIRFNEEIKLKGFKILAPSKSVKTTLILMWSILILGFGFVVFGIFKMIEVLI